MRPRARRRADAGLSVIGEIALQFEHILREGVGIALQRPPERPRDDLVRSRRAAQPQIDPARKQRVERAELLGDHQRRVIGEHDAPGPDPDAAGRRGDVPDHHRGRGAGDARHAVMLGHPVAGESQCLGMAGEIGRIGERLADGTAFDDGDEIEERIGCHAGQMGCFE